MSRGIWTATAATSLLHAAVLVVPLHFEASAHMATPAPVVLRFQAPPPVQPPEPEPTPEPEAEPVLEEPEPTPEPPPPPPKRERRSPQPEATPVATEPLTTPATETAPVESAPAVVTSAEVQAPVVVPPPAEEARPAPSEPTARRGTPNYRGWAAGVHAAFMRHRQYPPAALRLRLEGVAKVRVTVDRHGKLLRAPELAESSGHDVLDDEALRAAAAAAPFDVLPEGTPDEKSFVIPIAFRIVD